MMQAFSRDPKKFDEYKQRASASVGVTRMILFFIEYFFV